MKFNQNLSTKALQLGTSIVTILALSFVPSSANAKGQPIVSKSAALVYDGIDFGDDSSQWAQDGECDDPRFIGPATAVDMEDIDVAHDATDCLALYQTGDVSLKPAPSDIVADIDFGDNSSEWANNDICDDPRFGGAGADELLLDEDMGRDSADCKALFLSGAVQYLGDDINMQTIEFDGISFGDNTSEWKSDGECDDPRFHGTGMAAQLVNDDLGHDAVDCLALYKDGSITLTGNATPATAGTIDFGDDSSEWANDDECDDPRFAGEGVAGILLDSDLGHDASDCRTLFDAGKIYLAAGSQTTNSGIDFGDDDNNYANDGECDDPRFAGQGVATVLLEQDLGHDASDCRVLYENGQIHLANSSPANTTSVSSTLTSADYGDNASEWSNDGECDDPRFIGDGMASQLMAIDIGHDANDCKTLVDNNQISLITASNLDFGDDASDWPNDGECDDPRFSGPGVASKLDPVNFGHDASDCRALLTSGDIQFVGGFLSMVTPGQVSSSNQNSENNQSSSNIDWGDDGSQWAHDGECDDPRFSGAGSAQTLIDADLRHDATDCRTLFEAGQLELSAPSALRGFHNSGFDFGNNTSEYANNQICDDPRFSGPGADPILLAEDEGRDANDCKTLFRAGQVSLATDQTIDFGADTSQWANDNECDDPRFAGKSMAADLDNINILQDASDCRASFELGRIYFADHGVLDFGDDSSEWANDNECDDPRFAGTGAAAEPLEENLLKDASDCRALYRSSEIFLAPAEGVSPTINFGDNTSNWASDNECDDPRFFGPGSADELLEEDLGHDAQDCQALFDAGQIEFGAPALFDKLKGSEGVSHDNADLGGINFGDDSSSWANDGECDDPRFAGGGVAATLLEEDRGHDATDCRALLTQGLIEYIDGDAADITEAVIVEQNINFGDNSSDYANNNICDDLRFEGEGVDSVLLPEDEGHDANDCLAHFRAGTVTLANTSIPSAPTPGGIDFGDDASTWANDNECDDPRFEGEGVSGVLLDDDLGHDATDCSALFAQGKIQLIGDDASTTPVAPTSQISGEIDFGDNTSTWANDNQCDDPRFEGEGTSPPLLPEDEGHDANDCSALFSVGKVTMIGQSSDEEATSTPTPTPTEQATAPIDPENVDFGDNASLFSGDNECDDPRFTGPGMAPPAHNLTGISAMMRMIVKPCSMMVKSQSPNRRNISNSK